eukprot:UN01908
MLATKLEDTLMVSKQGISYVSKYFCGFTSPRFLHLALRPAVGNFKNLKKVKNMNLIFFRLEKMDSILGKLQSSKSLKK